MSSTTKQRIERKYSVAEEQLANAVETLSQYLPVHHHAGQHDWSTLRTIYLDSPDHRAYHEYLQDLPVRRKIRIRQYGIGGHFESLSWVELKEKRRNVSRKWRFRCHSEEVTKLLRGKNILKHLYELNNAGVKATYTLIREMIAELHLTPKVKMEYERVAFQSAEDQTIRVTLDRNLSYQAAGNGKAGALDGLVLEFKHNGTRPDWMQTLPAQLGVQRKKRFSKFGRSMNRIAKLPGQEAKA